jgi:predicted Zn-ribbon and HTH transcriptional regulator
MIGGELSVTKQECKSCGNTFTLNRMDRNAKYCPPCRPIEYRKIMRENRHGIYRRKRVSPKIIAEQKYIGLVLDKITKECALSKKYKPITEMRRAGKTYREIGQRFNITYQYAQHICKRFGPIGK